MAFRWPLSVSGKEVIKNNGPALGSEESSHRAEGYGQLSLFVVLKTLFEFADIPFDVPIKYGCDNQGLLTRVRERQKYTDLYPNATLSPDWDIVEAIIAYRQRFTAISQEHVKGHQDEKKAFDDLPPMVQLNVLADQYAGEYQAEAGMSRPLVPMLPTTRCQLTVAGKTVTRGITKRLHQHHATKRIKPKFIKLHGIANESDLDWTTFHAAVARFPHKRWLKKFLTDTLPSDYHRAHYGKIASGRCPHCGGRNTFHHRFQCQSEPMKQWTQSVFTEMVPKLRKCSERPLLWEALFQTSIPNANNDADLLRIHRLQHQQPDSLPWYGLLVNGIDELHTTYCNETDKTAARNWKTLAVTKVWEHLHKAWRSITDQMHDKSSSDNPFQQSLHYQARKLHQLSDRVPPRLRDTYFPEDINSWLLFSSPITISNWVKSYGKGIRRAIAQHEKHISSMKLITDYFSRQ